MELNKKKKKIVNSLCAFALALMMTLSSFGGLIEVKAAGTAPDPIITLAAAGSKEVKGKGLLGSGRRRGLNITTTIYVTVKNGDTTVEEASIVINPKETPKSDGEKGVWTVNLQHELVAGQTVYVKQKCNDDMSNEVSAVVKETLASQYKNKLKMPSGDLYLENTNASLVNEDEAKELLDMVKTANPTFADDIASVKLEYAASEPHGTIIITYTDKTSSEKINADKLNLVQITETSRGYTLEPYNVASNKIVGKVNGKGPFNDISVKIIINIVSSDKENLCKGGTCKIIKSNVAASPKVDPITGIFEYDVKDSDLELGKKWGIIVKEPHKFANCDTSVPEIALPEKVKVKDPKKLKPEEKVAIADAIRKANTTVNGISKLPKDPIGGTPAFIEISDDGKVKIINPTDVDGTWDSGTFTPNKNEDGTVKVSPGREDNILHLDKPEELLSNLPPDQPTIENKGGNVVITPAEVDTDAKKVIIEFKGGDGYSKTIIAEKTDTGWTTNDSIATVDQNGVVTIPTKSIKHGTTITASVEDNGGLTPEEPIADSGKTELLIKGSYKIDYNPGEGSGKPFKNEVEAGEEYTILKNRFRALKGKEFDYWQVGSEKKNAGDKIVINGDTEIKAIYRYIINPTPIDIITIVDHPVSYNMYKDAINWHSDKVTIEHIEVLEAPNVSKVGQTEAKISVRFSDGQFRTLTVKVNVIKDPKDTTIEELTNKVTELNTTIEGLNTSITEKDNKITELNGKITELEKQLKTCQEQCAADKAQCEKDKAALQKQIDELTAAKTALEEQARKDAQTIEELRKQIADLEGQLAECKKASKEKDSKIAELEDSIKDLKTKIESANNTNKELTNKLEIANQKIKDLGAQIEALKNENANLKNKITELGNTIKDKDSEIKRLTDRITELESQLKQCQDQCTADETACENDKKNLEKTIENLKRDLKDKSNELDSVKKELEETKKNLNTSNTENTELKKKVTEIEKTVKDLEDKVNKANEDLNKANKEIEDLSTNLSTEKEKNKELTNENEKNRKAIQELETAKKTLEEEKAKIEEKSKELENKVEVAEKEKEQLAKDKETLEAEVERLKKELAEKPDKCPTCDTKELKDKIAELEKTIENQKNDISKKDKEIADLKEKLANSPADTSKLDKQIAELNERIKELQGKLADKEKELNNKTDEFVKEKETWQKEKDNFIRDRRDNFYWRDYSYYPTRDYKTEKENNNLKRENADLIAENKKLKEANKMKDSISQMEEYVTVFYLDETLYKTFLGREFLTQAEMTDSKGYIKPFVSNNRTMLPIRYLALSLGMDVTWDQKTRTATFSNYKNNNVLNRGSVTINADTLEMKDQNGRIIYVDAKPVLINGRFYVSITNVTRAFGGSNGNINDGIKNTIEWNPINREVLVYKNIR